MKSSGTAPVQLISAFALIALAATANGASSGSLHFTPEISVSVYSFPGFSSWALETAEAEAALILQPTAIKLNWIDCASAAAAARCLSPHAGTDFIVRVVPKALPIASSKALGIAGSSTGYSTAFIFFDRVLAVRKPPTSPAVVLGRVLAHEIVHLLLPHEPHADDGLMRGMWSEDDLRFASAACFGVPARSIRLIRREALRRALASSMVEGN